MDYLQVTDEWHQLDDAPDLAGLPAVWPADHVRSEDGGDGGRRWSLRSPYPGLWAHDVLAAIEVRRGERNLPETAEGLAEAAREVLAWPEVLVKSYAR